MLLHVVIIGNVPLYHYKRHSKERAQNPCPTRRVGSFSWHHGRARVLADGGLTRNASIGHLELLEIHTSE
jgi:hypothetical protein